MNWSLIAVIAQTTDETSKLLGPLAALALCLLFLSLFYTGRILPRNTVRREDYDRAMDLAASYAEGYKTMTKATEELVITVRHWQKNGNGVK